jgi:hypothetical protein
MMACWYRVRRREMEMEMASGKLDGGDRREKTGQDMSDSDWLEAVAEIGDRLIFTDIGEQCIVF